MIQHQITLLLLLTGFARVAAASEPPSKENPRDICVKAYSQLAKMAEHGHWSVALERTLTLAVIPENKYRELFNIIGLYSNPPAYLMENYLRATIMGGKIRPSEISRADWPHWKTLDRMFQEAQRVPGEDRLLANFFIQFDKACWSFSTRLPHEHTHFREWEDVRSFLEHAGLPEMLRQMKTAWNKMTPARRNQIVDYMGRSSYPGLHKHKSYRIDYENNEPVKAGYVRELPELTEPLESYLEKHRGTASRAVLEDRYMKDLGIKVLKLFDIDASDVRSLPAPESKPSLLQRVKGALRIGN